MHQYFSETMTHNCISSSRFIFYQEFLHTTGLKFIKNVFIFLNKFHNPFNTITDNSCLIMINIVFGLYVIILDYFSWLDYYYYIFNLFNKFIKKFILCISICIFQ